MWSISSRFIRGLRLVGPRAEARVPNPVVHFATSSRGKILDEFPNVKEPDEYELSPEDHGSNHLLGGSETHVHVGESLKWLAVNMAHLFEFDHDESCGPEIEDVLRARTGLWEYVRFETNEDGRYFSFAKGDPVSMKSLPETFDNDEWAFIGLMAAEFAKGQAASFTLQEALFIEELGVRPTFNSRWDMLGYE